MKSHRWTLLILLGLAFSSVWAPTAIAAAGPGATGDKLSAEQTAELRDLFAQFKAAEDEAGRKAAFDKMLAMGTVAAALVRPAIDNALNRDGAEYVKLLEPKIRGAYIKRLESLSDADVEHILRTRFLWGPYILYGGSHPTFRQTYLEPVRQMKEMLLLKVSDIEDPQVAAMRKKLVEFAGYQARCHAVLGINPDPTVGRMSPTNIAYAPLDQPPTFLDNLHHHERTLILIHTVASPGARKVLMMTDQAAREIDVQEAEYVMAANEVRMLAGSIAWRADPLGCAVERDHSSDRKDGKASGHMSTVPGKHGFSDRNKRMGAGYYGSEGAGGGRSGPDYLNQLSYSGDGHGGPLYRLARNRVGVGRRGNVYTSQYATDKKLIHPCPATEDELWMPPGVNAWELRDSTARQAYRAMKSKAYSSAQTMIDRRRGKLPEGIDGVALRFFRAAIDILAEQAIQEMLAAEQSGDVFFANVLLNQNQSRLKGIGRFDKVAEEASQRLGAKDLQPAMTAGNAYYRLYYMVKDLPKEKFDTSRQELIRQLGNITRIYQGTIYAEAAEDAARRLSDPKSDADALLAFLKQRREAVGTVAQ